MDAKELDKQVALNLIKKDEEETKFALRAIIRTTKLGS